MSAETMPFKTELKQVLHLIIHSLYSHKDIFLRELISNASDALDTLRFEALTNHELPQGDGDFKIKLIADEAARTLTVSDNGIGMSRETIVENLGTIARSGTRAFLERLQQTDTKDRPALIGQFGVGFYSSFMVAGKVTVRSRPAAAGPDDGVQWESDGQGEFTVEPFRKETRGTDVILHLREEDKEFLNSWSLRATVKKYSDFVAYPIVVDVEKEEDGQKTTTEETINSRQAIWLRSKSEVTPEEYAEFYKHIAHDYQPPARTIHYAAEGSLEFKALLYLPSHKPMDMMWGESKKGLQLYIQRVFIMDDCEALLPAYLRFVRGVVDSADLPLNVSREMLQHNTLLDKIKSNLTGKILRELTDMKTREYDAYVPFYEELGNFLKEGVVQDWTNKETLADLLLLESTKTEPGKYTTLAQYVLGTPEGQTDIYYLTGESRAAVEHSPHLEAFRADGQEVLLLVDPVDEWLVQTLTRYKDKNLKAVDKGERGGGDIDEATRNQFKPLLDAMKEKLDDVKEVRLSARLKESAACLVAGEHDVGANMERIMRRMGKAKELPPTQRVLEVNPQSPAVQVLLKVFEQNAADERVEKYSRLLYDQALIGEGSKVKDPAAFARRVNELLVQAAG